MLNDGLTIAEKTSINGMGDCYALCEADFMCYSAQYSRNSKDCKLVGRSHPKPFADLGNLIVKYKDCRKNILCVFYHKPQI